MFHRCLAVFLLAHTTVSLPVQITCGPIQGSDFPSGWGSLTEPPKTDSCPFAYTRMTPSEARRMLEDLPDIPPDLADETFFDWDSMKRRIGDTEDIEPPDEMMKYHNFDELTEELHRLADEFSHIAVLQSLGRSVEGRQIWNFIISDNPGRHEQGEPEMKYVANMHGNEAVGRELMLQLAHWLLHGYGRSDILTRIVDSTRIHLVASMNPDGFEQSREGTFHFGPGRMNANQVDLNRNFKSRLPEFNINRIFERETVAVQQWVSSEPFVLSANFHGGSKSKAPLVNTLGKRGLTQNELSFSVANYPFDDTPEALKTYSPTPDDKQFKKLAFVYSKAHKDMHEGVACSEQGYFEFFPYGITNGAAWYNINGGMQDFNYAFSNCFEITIETGCHKFPAVSELRRYWDENKYALVAFIEQAHTGVRGIVSDVSTKRPVSFATIEIEGMDKNITTGTQGDFWRLLPRGRYTVTAHLDGYHSQSKEIDVSSLPPAAIADIALQPVTLLNDEPSPELLVSDSTDREPHNRNTDMVMSDGLLTDAQRENIFQTVFRLLKDSSTGFARHL